MLPAMIGLLKKAVRKRQDALYDPLVDMRKLPDICPAPAIVTLAGADYQSLSSESWEDSDSLWSIKCEQGPDKRSFE